jgi:peroxiredoxin
MVVTFVRTSAEYDVEIEEATWTLAGLNMPVGTTVTDARINRSLGYWNGSGLSQRFPPKNAQPTAATFTLSEAMAALEREPMSDFANEAAQWIILNTPDGPEVEIAANVILKYHTHRPDLAEFCREQDRVRHRDSKRLLQAILFNNAEEEVRAAACFTLALLLKSEADYGNNKEATDQAMHRFEQVISEFGHLGLTGMDLTYKSKNHLFDLRHTFVGHAAPELAGSDFGGQPIRLSDHRGKVVMVFFWSHGYNDVGFHRKLLQTFEGQPFVLLSINCDSNRTNAMALLEEREITWPTIADGNYGPIQTSWNIHGWPETFLVDRHGIIRYRELLGRDLITAVERLLAE